jgi:class 3 adenylate cyclase
MSGRRKNIARPDEVQDTDLVHSDIVRLGDVTFSRGTQEPGWRWSTHMKPKVGGNSCQTRHVGFVLGGRLHVDFDDGSSMDLAAGDVYEIGPGHDSWVVGDELYVTVSWEGARTWATPIGVGDRVSVTLLFTDLVGSTETASRIGEQAWSNLLARHNEVIRRAIAEHRGREVDTTGDGFLATFDGAVRAIRCAIDIHNGIAQLNLEVRAGIHTGEVDLVGTDVRGLAVHEAARIAGAAGSGITLVSEVTRALAMGSGATFGPGVSYNLKGIEGARVLYPVRDFA